ncbi:MAG: hypothetical protein PCFJNLEI_02762 [Verrucomicrobiae bacterium]|nr:hypothetical protein [Verrucomicrobiae bacterium]
MAELILKCISGPLQGHEFPLDSDQELVIGRGDEADLQIVEDTISRKHARIFFRNDEIVIEDLSKNGTYVNSRLIQKAVLMPGDLIYIGQSILKIAAPRPALVPTAIPAFAWLGTDSAVGFENTVITGVPAPNRAVSAFNKPQPVGSSTGEHFRGSLGDIALTDLLQLLSTSRKSGVLILRSADMLGKIFVEKGRIVYATMDEIEPVNPQKVLYRLLRWTEGTFEFDGPHRRDFPTRINENTDHLLLEAMHELDELNNLGPTLPSLHAEVEVANPLPSPLKDLAPGDLDFIQLVMRHKLVRDILDHYTGNDFEGYTYLKSLIGRRFLVVTL